MGRKRMNPRTVVVVAGAVATLLLAACGTRLSQGAALESAPALAAGRELLPDQQVQQVLNRFAFGGRPGDAARVRAMGVDRWIALQLHPERIDDRATDRLVASYTMLDVPTAKILESYREVREARKSAAQRAGSATSQSLSNGESSRDGAAARETMREIARRDPDALEAARRVRAATTELQSARLARAVMSERQLQEVIVDFWENHFSVFAGKGLTRFYLADYERDAIRPHALGKFRDLLGAVAKSPAMLYYLDNWRSTADSAHPTLASERMRRRAPGVRGAVARRRITPASQLPQRPRRRNGLNENYGRELMELHTLGVDGGYTQNDVIEVARAFTGWTIDPRDGSFAFRPQIHDAGEKVVLGHRLAAGRGIEDGEEVLDILASSPATAHFIARKLVVHFVSDSAPTALVERVAETYMHTGGDIREMVRTIATSPEFFSRAAYRSKVKTLFELVASALRAMDAAPDTTHRTAAIVGKLGQPIFGRQTPDGWPDHGDAWMNTGAILNRINFGIALANGRVPGASLASWPYADSLSALSHEQQVDGVIATILGGEVSPATREVLVSGENPMLSKYADSSAATASFDVAAAADGGAMANGGGSMTTGFPTLPATRPANSDERRRPRARQASGLQQILGLALGAPEFQRR